MPDAGENAAIQQKRVFTQPERKADLGVGQTPSRRQQPLIHSRKPTGGKCSVRPFAPPALTLTRSLHSYPQPACWLG